jgi:hypothetical protein
MPRSARAALTFAVAAFTAVLAPSAQAATADGIFNARYCEVLELHGALPEITVTVWNTLGLNTCPPREWTKLRAGPLAEKRGAVGVLLNGPRHFVMDRASTRKLGPVARFGSLAMRKQATIPIRTPEELRQTPYTERTIARRNTWQWRKGRQIYELIASNGARYLMQAYAQIVDPNQTLSSLRSLGGRLQLPEGWRFRTRRLHKDLVLEARGTATIIQDELQNTYQRLR